MGRLGVTAVACVAACTIVVSGGAAASQQAHASTYTGFGFDACTAPSLNTLTAWQASPYRALGIYIGGVNRACGDGNLTASWVTSAVAQGWSLLPLYVGLQAPCVSQSGLQKLSTIPNTAGQQGLDAANDAIARAGLFGLPAGSPIYFDMEGYSTTNATCSKAVQAFVAGWNGQLRASGYVAGVYGSAASTIRDLQTASSPDAVWIANWNGVASVFGDKYVPDSLWPNHQRIHQFKGGHNETWGGVTINIDNDFVDSAVVGTSAPPPAPPPPPAGSVGSGDSLASASWPAGAFTTTAVVTLTPVSPPPTPAAYAVKLTVTESDGVTPVASFGAPVDLHLAAQGAGLVPAYSPDGVSWVALKPLVGGAIPPGLEEAYKVNSDRSFDILTRLPGMFGLIADTTPPGQPQSFGGKFVAGKLNLSWQPARDNSGVIASYRVLLDGAPLASLPGNARTATVHAFHPSTQTVYRVQAMDQAGNAGTPTPPLVVVPSPKPAALPRPVPQWAWALYTWQRTGAGGRPALAPRRPPAWYWAWATWRAAPFRIRH